MKTVAAFEVPLPTENQRNEFLKLLRQIAKTEGLHVDASTYEELVQTARAMPASKMTVHAAVWRGTNDEASEAVIMDQADHLGQVWIMFSRGGDPNLAAKFRNNAVKAIFARWPGTLSLPILSTGTIPLRRDLIRTATGYKLAPSATANYGTAVNR